MTKFGRFRGQGPHRPRCRGDPGRARRRRDGHRRHGRARRRQRLRGELARRPAAAEADRPDRHPGLQRAQRLRHRRDRGAGRHAGDQGRRGRHRPGGRASRRWARWACSARGQGAPRTSRSSSPSGRYGSVRQDRGRARHRPDAGRVRAGGHGVRAASTASRVEQFAEGRRRRITRTRCSTRSPSTARSSLWRRSWRGDDLLPEHAADVLPDRRRRGRRRCSSRARRLRRLDPDVPAAGGQDLRVGDDLRPVDRTAARCSPTSTRSPGWPPTPAYEQAGVGPAGPRPRGAARLLRHRRAAPLRQPAAVRAGRGGRLHRVRRGRWRDGRRPSTCRAACSPRATRSARPASPTSTRSTTHLRGEAGDRQIEGARVGLTHVIGLASACAVHVLERPARSRP